jgi:hypothetical protein
MDPTKKKQFLLEDTKTGEEVIYDSIKDIGESIDVLTTTIQSSIPSNYLVNKRYRITKLR